MKNPSDLQKPGEPPSRVTTDRIKRRRNPDFLGPIILIGIGFVLLLNNMNVLGWEIWIALLRLWPLILVAVGLDMMIGRQSIWGSFVVAFLFIGMVAFGIYYLGISPTYSGQPLSTEQISQSLEGATRAQIELNPGVGGIQLAAAKGDSTDLIFGAISLDSNQRVTRDFRLAGDVAQYTLRESSGGFNLFFPIRSGRGWNLQLSRQVPIALTIKNGIGDAAIDLRDVTLSDLRMNVGIGNTTITLSAKGNYSAKVDGGIGNLNLSIPQGVAARIRTNQGLGNLSVSGQFPRQGDLYVSAGFDTAQNRVDLTVSGGIGNVNLLGQTGTQ